MLNIKFNFLRLVYKDQVGIKTIHYLAVFNLMGIVALLTMIVITFALFVGGVIGMLCGEIFGDIYEDSDMYTGGASWFGGALNSLIKYTGGSDFAALPVDTDKVKPDQSIVTKDIEELSYRLFSSPSDIDWAKVDMNNLTPDVLEKLYKLYERKQQANLNSNSDTNTNNSDNTDDEEKTNNRVKNILEALRKAGVKGNENNDADSSYVADPLIYADVGAGDCKNTLAIAKSIHASKIYNIDVSNYCPAVTLIHYVDGSVDKTIDIPDNSVNVITAIDSLHHMSDRDHKISEIKRILAPDGVLLIRDHIVDTPLMAQIVTLQHVLYYIDYLTTNDLILDYNEFKKAISTYMLENQLHLFDRDDLDKMMLGGGDMTNGKPKLSMIGFDLKVNFNNTFIAVYKKIE
jgi:SAM-dependent methyltransferase